MVILLVDEAVDCALDVLEIQPFLATAIHPSQEQVIVPVRATAFGMARNDVGCCKLPPVKPSHIRLVAQSLHFLT